MRDLVGYAVFVMLVLGLVLWIRPDESRLKTRGDTPSPEVEIEGLTVAATATRPGFVARRARPGAAGRAITLGGWREGLELSGVSVTLADGVVLQASEGRLRADVLDLSGDVFVERGGDRIMTAGAVSLAVGEFRFHGLVQFSTPRGRSSAIDPVLSTSELLARLR